MTPAPTSRGVRLFGADYSVYTRIAKLALMEKGVGHEFVPVDIFAKEGAPGWYLERQPFARIPAFEHDELRLFETAAITRYVDEAFSGPPLQPAGARERAVMTQIIGILDSYAYRTLVWDIYVERVERKADGKQPDEARIAAALPRARTCLSVLAALKRPGDWLLGDRPSLADLHLAPILSYFRRAPEGRDLLGAMPVLRDWYETMAQRPAFVETEPAHR